MRFICVVLCLPAFLSFSHLANGQSPRIHRSEEEAKLQLWDSWVGKEVTEDPRYFNSSLAMSPYQTWNDSDQD